ncbi:conserved domain protein [Parasutterella excrementihominis YIT 11859]|uniref:Conserved domain protein n=2 Tax=Parasutterella excrementihominis TaxID=487175 RepID=F3QMK3_9BURK|nr:conserved domain protein [Parasutterella excrementihominis YIT 11859]
MSSAIFLPKSTLLTDKLLNLNLFRSIKMNETTFTYNELKILALMAALMVSGKVKVTVPELMQGYEKDRENVAVLDRELSGAVQV